MAQQPSGREARPEPLNPGLYRLHRIFAIAFIAFAVIMLAIGTMMLVGRQPDSAIGLVGLFLVPFGALHWYAAVGARDGKDSGKVISRIIGTLWLFGFPVGTALGIYVWIRTSGESWRSRDVAQPEAP